MTPTHGHKLRVQTKATYGFISHACRFVLSIIIGDTFFSKASFAEKHNRKRQVI
jgi:hypothetical protein